jgi:hypothetical protein
VKEALRKLRKPKLKPSKNRRRESALRPTGYRLARIERPSSTEEKQ